LYVYIYFMLKLWFIVFLAKIAYFFKCINLNSFLDFIFGFYKSRTHFIETFAISFPSKNELLFNQILINLRSENLVYFITMEKSYFPKLIAETFWKIFKISRFISFYVFKCYQLARLLVTKFIYQYFIENMRNSGVLAFVILLSKNVWNFIRFCVL